ncbi:mRNA export factor GLE1 [Cynoglossus semilaevis]|uniref:mRNA export factor GLE1 n=1 Tax=Cynoglossus semilaevis TaxID=244447 RepID=A0A3P8W8D5_CYNSE|nr:nucleoporin GLE1 [Cynoglossus semilaevis]
MPVESLRWETLEALKNSPKGKITFDPHWFQRDEHIMTGCKEALSLSSHSGVILKRLSSSSLQKSFSLDSDSGNSSPGLSEVIQASIPTSGSGPDVNGKLNLFSAEPSSSFEHMQVGSNEVKDKDPDVVISEESSSVSGPTISLLSPKAVEMAGRIIKCEEEHREKAKMALRRRQEIQEKILVELVNSESEQMKRFEEFMELKQRQEYQSVRDMMDRETKESIGRQEKLKEEQRHRMKILNLRVREAELQRQREAELERQRQVEGKERLRNLNSIQEEILQLNQLLDPSSLSNTELSSLSSYSSRGNQLCSQVSDVVRKTAEGAFPSLEDMTLAERALHEMRALIRLMQEEMGMVQEKKKKAQEEEEQRRKQEELHAKQEAQKKEEQLIKEKAQRKGIQNSAEDTTLKWYNDLQETAAQCAQSFDQLNSAKDTMTKKLKLELQKAATIPVSQIASNSGSQLQEIFDKMDRLLSGQAVLSGGKSVSISQHPQGRNFVYYKLAEKFVKQGEEEVASHHEAAFPIAVVASGVWERHPQVGDLIHAHLHKKCPYAVPHYPPMKDGTSVEEYQRVLGYRVDDNGVEGQDSFLKRMSGMIRLYAAVIQTRWPYGSKQEPLPHGLNHGWRWLAQMLNMEPLADITATLLYDFLEVCGLALMKQYQGQFWKLLLLLKDDYFPRIEAVTSSGQMGSVIRLKQFLEAALRSQQISPPKGQLSSHFWRS